nr:transposase [Paraburkholderia phenoliruptrix]
MTEASHSRQFSPAPTATMSPSFTRWLTPIPPIAGERGPPLSTPRIVQGDRGYDHDKYRRPLHAAGIATQITQLGEPYGSGLGKTRWVVECTISWPHNFRRLRIRFERLAFIHEAFMKNACCVICWRKLKNSSS